MYGYDWRGRRNNTMSGFQPNYMQYRGNYCTDVKFDESQDLPNLHQLNMLNNPLQKNLADSVPTADSKPAFIDKKPDLVTMGMPKEEKEVTSTFSGISTFVSGVFSIITGTRPFQMLGKMVAKTDNTDARETSPSLDIWTVANSNLNKNQYNDCGGTIMNDCHAAVTQCEDKIAHVRSLLTTTVKSKPLPVKRRPKRAFHEPSSQEEVYEDAFAPEDFSKLADMPYVEYNAVPENVTELLNESYGSKLKVEPAIMRNDIIDTVNTAEMTELVAKNGDSNEIEPSTKTNTPNKTETIEEIIKMDIENTNIVNNLDLPKTEPSKEINTAVISSCEEKMAKIRALLQSKNKKNDQTTNEVTKVHSKRHKNPNGRTDKRIESTLRRNIEDDMSFANELNDSSVENSPRQRVVKHPQRPKVQHPERPTSLSESPAFDEVSGRFRNSSTTESEDSFQVVFTDVPKTRRLSVESDDSFIVFEDSPDSCFTSTDVFGESATETETETESEHETDSDSGLTCRLNHYWSRTVSDLTDSSLYEEGFTFNDQSGDEVDCAVTVKEELNYGLLLNPAKKLLKKDQPPKHVRFSDAPPKVHVMRVWTFAARQARAGHWEQHARDRDRFKRRIADVDVAISWVLKPQHRTRVMFQRIRPFLNAQRRLEEQQKKIEAEKRREEEKQREEEERKRQEEERIREEEERTREVNKEDLIEAGTDGNVIVEQVNNCDETLVKKVDVDVKNVVKDGKNAESNGKIVRIDKKIVGTTGKPAGNVWQFIKSDVKITDNMGKISGKLGKNVKKVENVGKKVANGGKIPASNVKIIEKCIKKVENAVKIPEINVKIVEKSVKKVENVGNIPASKVKNTEKCLKKENVGNIPDSNVKITEKCVKKVENAVKMTENCVKKVENAVKIPESNVKITEKCDKKVEITDNSGNILHDGVKSIEKDVRITANDGRMLKSEVIDQSLNTQSSTQSRLPNSIAWDIIWDNKVKVK